MSGAPATDMRGVHAPFTSPVFYPQRPWSVNYLGALTGGPTQLMVTPAQHRSTGGTTTTATLRRYPHMHFRLYYSGNTAAPALSAAPSIVSVDGTFAGDS